MPQANSDAITIKQLMHSKTEKYLGLHTRPDGINQPHLNQVRKRVKEWTSLINEGHLPTQSVWLSYRLQLWAGVKYGLGASSASIKELEEGLGTADYYLLSKLGVVGSAKKELRYIPAAYGGLGLYDLTCETDSQLTPPTLRDRDSAGYIFDGNARKPASGTWCPTLPPPVQFQEMG